MVTVPLHPQDKALQKRKHTTAPTNESQQWHFPRTNWETGTHALKRRSWHCERHRKEPRQTLLTPSLFEITAFLKTGTNRNPFFPWHIINKFLSCNATRRSKHLCQSLPLYIHIHTSSQPVPPSHFSSEM
jgi:hypothetical protein